MPACLPEQLWKIFSGGRPSCRPSSRSSCVASARFSRRLTASSCSGVAWCDAHAIAISLASRSSRARTSGSAWIGFDELRRKHVSAPSPASATTAPSLTATACTRWRASTTPFRRCSTTNGSTVAEPTCGRGLGRTRLGPGPATKAPPDRPDTRTFRNGHWRRRAAAATVRRVPRKHRDVSAGLFHVYTHCVWAAPALYRDDADRLTFLRELASATAKFEWTCVAYCLMRTHYHLILAVLDGVLPRGMHAL